MTPTGDIVYHVPTEGKGFPPGIRGESSKWARGRAPSRRRESIEVLSEERGEPPPKLGAREEIHLARVVRTLM